MVYSQGKAHFPLGISLLITPPTENRIGLVASRIPAFQEAVADKKSLVLFHPFSGLTSTVHSRSPCIIAFRMYLYIRPRSCSDPSLLLYRINLSNQHSRTHFTFLHHATKHASHLLATSFSSHCSRVHSFTYLISAIPVPHYSFPDPPVPISCSRGGGTCKTNRK